MMLRRKGNSDGRTRASPGTRRAQLRGSDGDAGDGSRAAHEAALEAWAEGTDHAAHQEAAEVAMARKKKRSKRFIQKAVARMEEKGTVGSFGRATPGKIARAKRHGGKEAKKAIFAANMKKIAQRR